MIDRIAQLIEVLGISVRAFELQISASNGLIRKAISNNTDIQSKWLCSIADNFPQVNSDWLLTGRGSMLREEKVEPKQSAPAPVISAIDENMIYKLYKEKDEEVKSLHQEIGRLKEQVEGLVLELKDADIGMMLMHKGAGDVHSSRK